MPKITLSIRTLKIALIYFLETFLKKPIFSSSDFYPLKPPVEQFLFKIKKSVKVYGETFFIEKHNISIFFIIGRYLLRGKQSKHILFLLI